MTAVQRIKFTRQSLLALKQPADGKRLTIYDTLLPKLALRMTSAGVRTYYVVKRVGTTMVWVKLGRFQDMSVDQARSEAQKILGDIAGGQNPAEARRIVRGEPTLSDFFSKIYGERHGIHKRTWKDDQQRYQGYLEKPLGGKKLSTITRQMISTVLGDVQKSGRAVATVRLIRALISHMFNKAVEWGYLESSPAQGLRVEGTTVKRDRFLMGDELPRFFKSLAEEPNPMMRDFVMLALLTGARRANLCAMRWDEVYLDEAVWRIPMTKNGEPQNATLSPWALEVLRARREVATGEFVFPGTGATGHIVEPKYAVSRVMERAQIPYGRKIQNGVTLHDLRRTNGSWQAIIGSSLPIIGKSLNHKSQQATAIYARLDIDPVRRSVNAATEAMFEAAGLTGKDMALLTRQYQPGSAGK